VRGGAGEDRQFGFGPQLRRDRIAAGLTQEQLAERAGLSVRTIRDLEHNRSRQPRGSTVRQVVAVLTDSAIRREDSVPTLRLAQLPADITDFTGRAAEADHLLDVVSRRYGPTRQGVPVMAITGPGGIGKTILAVHSAHQVADYFPDGQLYLTLRGSGAQPVTVTEALARMLRDLGADPADMQAEAGELAARYRSHTAGLRLLIVLDDARDASQVRPLIPGGDACAVLVTSRNGLPDLESAHRVELPVLPAREALLLFRRIVGQARSDREPEEVAAVLRSCAGLPLAIRIAAARLATRPAWQVGTLAARLADEQRRLDELQAGDLAVRATFTVSYANLEPAVQGAADPQRTFRLLGVADGEDISGAAAAALADRPAAETERALELLVDEHLLSASAPGRYRFHDLLRVYAAERADAEIPGDERAAAVRRLLGWYLHTAGAACRVVNPHRRHLGLAPPDDVSPAGFSTHAEALGWLDAEHANLLAAVSQASRCGEHEFSWQLASTMWEPFNLRGRIEDWLEAYETGLASARQLGDLAAEDLMLASLAGSFLHAARPEAALRCLHRRLDIQQELGDSQGTGAALVNIGICLTELGRLDEALSPLTDAIKIFRTIGYRNGEAYALCGIGAVHARRGTADAAIHSYQQGQQILRALGNMTAVGECLVEMSSARLALGQHDILIEEAAEAIDLSRAAGARRTEAQALVVAGRAHRARGDLAMARQQLEGALSIFRELGHPTTGEIAAEVASLPVAD
jgi:tetratricopeptide (TPR) repeat protein/transcriptional regulator with XRE-family HTH domain